MQAFEFIDAQLKSRRPSWSEEEVGEEGDWLTLQRLRKQTVVETALGAADEPEDEEEQEERLDRFTLGPPVNVGFEGAGEAEDGEVREWTCTELERRLQEIPSVRGDLLQLAEKACTLLLDESSEELLNQMSRKMIATALQAHVKKTVEETEESGCAVVWAE